MMTIAPSCTDAAAINAVPKASTWRRRDAGWLVATPERAQRHQTAPSAHGTRSRPVVQERVARSLGRVPRSHADDRKTGYIGVNSAARPSVAVADAKRGRRPPPAPRGWGTRTRVTWAAEMRSGRGQAEARRGRDVGRMPRRRGATFPRAGEGHPAASSPPPGSDGGRIRAQALEPGSTRGERLPERIDV